MLAGHKATHAHVLCLCMCVCVWVHVCGHVRNVHIRKPTRGSRIATPTHPTLTASTSSDASWSANSVRRVGGEGGGGVDTTAAVSIAVGVAEGATVGMADTTEVGVADGTTVGVAAGVTVTATFGCWVVVLAVVVAAVVMTTAAASFTPGTRGNKGSTTTLDCDLDGDLRGLDSVRARYGDPGGLVFSTSISMEMTRSSQNEDSMATTSSALFPPPLTPSPGSLSGMEEEEVSAGRVGLPTWVASLKLACSGLGTGDT